MSDEATTPPAPSASAAPLPRRGRLLGLDHGDKYVGLALSDAAWLTVRPLRVLKRRTNAEDFAAISADITRHEVVAVVVGLPTNPERDEADADHPTRANTVRRWASRLAAAITAPVYLWEEQFSTLEAQALVTVIPNGHAGKGEAGGRLDDHAAAVILRGFIDAHPESLPAPRPVRHRHNPPPSTSSDQ